MDFRQHGHRDIQYFAELFVPVLLMDVIQQSTRSVAWIRAMKGAGPCAAAGHFPKEPAIDGAERQFTGFRAMLQFRIQVEDPANLAAGKIGVDDQAGFFPELGFVPVSLEPFADTGALAALPDDCPVDRLAGFAVPYDRGFALIGDPDGGKSARADSGNRQGFSHHFPADPPDFFRFVLDPARLWIVLGEFAVGPAQDFTFL